MPSKGLIPADFLFGLPILLFEPHQSHFQMVLIYSKKRSFQVTWPSLVSLPLFMKFIHLIQDCHFRHSESHKLRWFLVCEKFLTQLIFHLFRIFLYGSYSYFNTCSVFHSWLPLSFSHFHILFSIFPKAFQNCLPYILRNFLKSLLPCVFRIPILNLRLCLIKLNSKPGLYFCMPF